MKIQMDLCTSDKPVKREEIFFSLRTKILKGSKNFF